MPTTTTSGRRAAVATAAGALALLYAVTFASAAVAHLGVRVPLGFAVLAEPRIVPAVVVESLCALALAASAFGVLTRRTWAWRVAVAAHAFALAGVLLGIVAVAAGGGPSTPLNDAYHLTMAALLAAGLLALRTRTARAALGPTAGGPPRR